MPTPRGTRKRIPPRAVSATEGDRFVTTTALDGIPAAPPAEPVGWHLAAHVVFPDVHEPDILPLYVEYGARAPRIDDAYDRWERGWGEFPRSLLGISG